MGDCFFDASERHYPDIELLYRHADILLTDYSSCFIDFMLTGRPMVSFAFDRNNYESAERGLFYEQEMVFPGPICSDFGQLMVGLEKTLETQTPAELDSYNWKLSFFHKYRDNCNSDRVMDRVRSTYRGSKMLWLGKRSRTDGKAPAVTFVYSPAHNITNRYRIFNIVEHLRDLGSTCRVVTADALKSADLINADAMFICRIPMSETLRDHCETFQAQGGKIVFDLDDLIHDIDAFSQSEYFRKRPEFASDFTVLSTRTLQMIETSDLVTVTTAALAQSIEGMEKNVEVIPNSISSTLIEKFADLPAQREAGGPVRICYLSGTATHSEDFEQCRAALASALGRHPNAELHIVGKLDATNPADETGGIDCIRHDLMSYDAMHDFLAGMDINLAPLAPSYFNDCKSELKIFDAALHGVPTIASPTRSYADTINDGSDGILARTPEDWGAALDRLIGDAALRRTMGRAAFEAMVPRFAARNSARRLAGAINALLRGSSAH